MNNTEINEIMNRHPSICYGCEHNRNTATDHNTERGYVACAAICRNDNDFSFVEEVKEVVEGWVDLKSSIFKPRSGILSNLQIMTRGVRKCKRFNKSTC